MSSSEKSEFENVSGGWIGVQVHDDSKRAGFKGIGLRPGGRIWLDEEEQVATANRPRNSADNPFVNGHLKLTAAKQEMQNRRPIGDSEEPQAPAPEEPAEGAQGDGAPQGEENQGDAAGDGGPPQKPESEMTQAEIDAHNAKAAAARAIPAKQQPPSPPPTTTASSEKKPPAQPEQVATPDATAKAGDKPEGQRGATEQVATPEAQGK